MAPTRNWFSNMLPMDSALGYQGLSFPTVEHFYQAMKLRKDDVAGRAVIAALRSPFEAKRACNTARLEREGRLREDWHDVRLAVMEFALRQKFARGTSWHRKLMATEGEIVEWNTWSDSWWGKDERTGEGANHLGRILMTIRAEGRSGQRETRRRRRPSPGPRRGS